jgi:hypothetical protein
MYTYISIYIGLSRIAPYLVDKQKKAAHTFPQCSSRNQQDKNEYYGFLFSDFLVNRCLGDRETAVPERIRSGL